MPNDRRDSIALQFAELIRGVERRRPDSDSDTVMRELTVSAARALPGASSAGITIATRAGEVTTLAATMPEAEKIDDIQARNGEGPCLEAAWEQHVMRIDDMAVEQRWPSFARDALDNTTVRSVLSFQLFKNRNDMGALNFYADRPFAFEEDSMEMGLIVATHTALAWSMLQREEQFRSALASRDIIGQAKGILMERFNVDAVAAFELLKRLSQDSNRPLATIAEQLVNAPRDTP
ncbi:GAF and ANTAR domain-containing protein [soil metagenome]